MGLCSTPKVEAPRQSQQELDLMAAQKKQLDSQALQFEEDKKDRALLEPMVLKSMKLKKNVDASGSVSSYENIQALIDKNAPVTRENLNPEYFADDNEKDAFILSAESMDREKKAAAGLLPIPASVEQDITGQKENLLQNLYERYGKRYMESTGGSKGFLGFEKNAAELREKIRTGKAIEATNITKGLVSNYLRPQGYGYELYDPNVGLVGSMSNALTPYSKNNASGYYDSYMGGYIRASDRAAMYNMIGTAGGIAGGAYLNRSIYKPRYMSRGG